jgi:O-antigen ligase
MAVVSRNWAPLGTRQRALGERLRLLAFALLGATVAWACGNVIAGGDSKALAVVAGAGGLAGATFVWKFAARRFPAALAVEVPLLLLLLANQVFRIRTTAELGANPVDAAGAFRVTCVGLAGLLGLFGILAERPHRMATEEGITTRPFRLYIAYGAVVFVGTASSVDAPLTFYRGVEIVAALVVMAGAWRALGPEASRRVGNVLFWFIAALVGSVWFWVIATPGQAIHQYSDLSIPIPYALVGVLPSISSNSLGLFGAILALWSLARITSSDPAERLRGRIGYPLLLMGVATLVGAQYRTGYVAFILGLIVFLFLRRNWAVLMTLGLAVAVVLIAVPSVIGVAEPYALRGTRTENISTLDSRTVWWSQALRVWREEPVFGRGLLTATRFEVLAPLGLDRVSTIHGTWIEALVGTGVVGITLLALAYLITFKRAVVAAIRDKTTIIPLLLLLVLAVRSITGSSFESFQEELLIFLWVALSLRGAEPRPSQSR